MATKPLLTRSLRPTLPSPTSQPFICKTCRRHEATYRRTRKALRVKLDPSFAPSTTETQDHIIFNPPSSVPSVYHTPPKFLPRSDPRRALHTAAAAESSPSTSPSKGILAQIASQRTTRASSLVPVRPIQEQKYHLDESQIEEIRRLRKEDPRQWTRRRLAERFECSQFFVSLICSAPEVAGAVSEIAQETEREHERSRAKWGRKKRDARDARVERKKLWGMDA